MEKGTRDFWNWTFFLLSRGAGYRGLFTGEIEMYIYMYLSALNFNRKFTFKT